MGVLIVPPEDEEPWPTLGPDICDFLEERSIFGPGSLKGLPYEFTPEWRALVYRIYEVHPAKVKRSIAVKGKGKRGTVTDTNPFAGRRRFKRVGISVRKGLAKTEAEAQIVYAELHPDGPTRCDGFDSYNRPVGRPVRDPYIPMLAVTVEQVEELAYGCLYVLCTEGPDADLFDSTLERVVRLDDRGRADGKAVPLANSPGSRDGARTTLNAFDEPHRLYMPRALQAHETMLANTEKRVLEDPWSLYVGTAGEPGQKSVAEQLHQEAELIVDGKVDRPVLFYFHRDAGQTHNGDKSEGHDLRTLTGRVDAISEATGPTGEFGPGQFESIASQWDRPQADKQYLERVWLNLWTRSNAQAFDIKRWQDELEVTEPIPDGAFITAGFDGARWRDSTGIVLTDIETGRQQLWATWERPLEVEDWEVPESEVNDAWEQIVKRFDLWIAYCDPPFWMETVGAWASRWPDQFEEWWTNRNRPMATAVRAYKEAILSGAVTHVARAGNEGDEAFTRHVAAAGRRDTKMWDLDDETGEEVPLFLLQKMHPDRKFDNAMAAVLSWQARLDALRKNAQTRQQETFVPYRIR